ncbi:hypothetical protein [Metabacillus halosaccharovorans]|uniref:hypothetical protein n=1 Tax=Metabacillus halosaccharovorans TaxID=930124 RepID=UPI001C1FEC1D|nr:hypothetical protein [Metabacillus halosaccharovorans]MBU7592821.1 hypothetical protein [Metabacillus halosaccharovorans]
MKKSIGLFGLVCFLFVGCNPKPTTEVINEPFDKTMKEAELAETEQVTTVSKREDYLRKLAEIEQSLAEFDQVLENGTMESLEYISVQAGLTKERCYELVDRYME